MSSTQILEDALQLLKTKGWTKTYMARKENDAPVYPESPEAACFCAIGALRRAVHDVGKSESCADYSFALESLYRTMPRSTPRTWSASAYNDQLDSIDDAVAWFEKAIESSKHLP